MELSEDIYGKLINIAGRQRMLSQRIGFLFLTLSSQAEKRTPVNGPIWKMLEKALEDFEHGYRILLNGDDAAGLPQLSSARIATVLDAGTIGSGRWRIDRFLTEAHALMEALSGDTAPERAAFDAFSQFVLVELLQTLQAIVNALEEDFAEEMQRRRDKRHEDSERVLKALQEIQKASKFSRMIALNAKISADRAGPYGKEFGALTEELKNISSAITDSSEDIMRHLESI
ncbi:type IV pili methyl-accepting chemotaxis transducer N-terminal domain-containing protein [Roseibium aggregatum]|uniref:Type IV pili methyl-accepting chemotaxis transducer N-terminal domain-containing protein n=1 Tax=Roseibium aggregatum TaxID=187304 RepID=A0A939EA61_9HYPH|nr:type IV pili methyl-accepting chemotaxis transducer N-terminal domain-containing protein [Roseibium aggregatum]MBN9669661.1 type IV pili methyl-accepting chemotaxis transducer N-terminal domain-containing protein [Roseibium aggregatum]